MEIKITGAASDLQNIHKLIYDDNSDTEVDEEYGPNEGYQKEPLVVALITGVTTAITALIANYIVGRNAKINAETERYKIDKEAETERIKIFLRENRKWKELEITELKALNTTDKND